MGNFLQTILNLFQSLFNKQPANTSDHDLDDLDFDLPDDDNNPNDEPEFSEANPPDHVHGMDCYVVDIELPATQYAEDVPEVFRQSDVEVVFASAANTAPERPALTRRVAGCNAQIHPFLDNVNIRLGPGLGFISLAKARGGLVFPVVGATTRDSDGYRWINVKVGPRSGWIRNDLVSLTRQCLGFSFFDEDDIKPPPAPPPTDKFPRPTQGIISQGYHSRHRALDIVVDRGAPIRAAADGVVIRLMRCTGCEETGRENFFPCPSWLFRSEAWGFGYGNFLIVRHQYHVLPPTVRAEMDTRNLTGAFAYVLYAHFSKLDVTLGQVVRQGQILGATGNTGCSSAPHLHFEVKIGNEEVVDDRWLNQIALHPSVMFDI